jgi:hypothetical protein
MARHLTIARKSGAEAGLESLVEFVNGPVGSKLPTTKDIRAKLKRLKSDASRLKWYCEAYGVTAEPKKAKNGSTSRGRASRSGGSSSRAVSRQAITAGEAWEALGAGADFEPNDHDRPASSGMLYRLNTEGQLSLND